ncbi:hypothetical protein [Ureibacillus acetophenoni]|uniref:Uncharacterized protein n=1 Tax=Ureibacillus acetophenoni TaxID=614649 RepID=A0A285U9D6_9BACL|nr:hypothetical protein [Ureibacillus acetophenoni]SOC38534.1 hypothetical protein SAMN05877842_104166 [Ureibacillus acetophenoni]
MEILAQLSNVSLSELLSNSLRDSLGLTMKNQWDEQIHHGRVHELYYFEINKNETNPEFLQQFIRDWKPVYEQLSLQHDYNALRLELATKDSYNITAQLDELMDDVHTPRLELWMDPATRTQHIAELDDAIFENKNIPKKQLHYLASNTLSIQKLYELIEQKMTEDSVINYAISVQTQQQMKENFDTLHKAIQQYKEKQEIEILNCLVDKLEDFYSWLKGLLTAIKKHIQLNFRNR